MALNEDTHMVIADAPGMVEDMDANLKIVDFFSICTSIICFVLGLFQLIMTISANIKDSMWELGVLRSMGCTNSQIIRVMVYELVSNTISAMTLGYISGIVVSVLAIAQFHTLVELPLRITFPYGTMAIVGACALTSLAFGSKFGTSELFSRNIASILKGC
jgi:predicted lysophospholipase L1 biosynthesis ABC-type transport system permease subunit